MVTKIVLFCIHNASQSELLCDKYFQNKIRIGEIQLLIRILHVRYDYVFI